MLEKIYTIPVNEAFDACRDDHSLGCPVCLLYRRLQMIELDTILGAAMMEPDIRIMTNKQGFCGEHYKMMMVRKNRLGMALTLESRLDTLRESCRDNPLAALTGSKGTAAAKTAASLDGSCYVCGHIEEKLSKMLANTLYLWEREREFREKFSVQPYICLPHYRRLYELRGELPKKLAGDFTDALSAVTMTYFDSLRADIKQFIRKFDYRFDAEPWGNSRNSVERAVSFLCGDTHDEL